MQAMCSMPNSSTGLRLVASCLTGLAAWKVAHYYGVAARTVSKVKMAENFSWVSIIFGHRKPVSPPNFNYFSFGIKF